MKFLSFFRPDNITAPKSSISSLAPKVLTEKEDIEKIQPYLDKLKGTIDTKGVTNIALTGSYGSGKSTILKTFKAINAEYKYLNVSLAAFNQKDGKLNSSEQEDLERLLEVSILQQIIYHVNPGQIPESRFKRIVNRKWWQYLYIAVLFVVWVICMILSFKYNYLDKINPNTWIIDKPFDWLAISTLFIVFSGMGLLSTFVMQLFTNSKINKVNIKGELELSEKVDKSVFNEHLEEILYFFERTEYNVVIIEDLDRFDNTDIFTKLREINILLNNSEPIGREINFIYAVGDDLFKDKKERVKFFEYIIPVIPFINSSNAREQLQTLIKESGLNENIFTKDFMSDVVTFIDDIDMRLLINIFHEFVIYRQALKPEFVKKPEELFSIITYKNIEPEDFSKLNTREGKLYKLINNKKNYIEEFISKINAEIESKLEIIDILEKQSISDIKELRAIYVNQVLTKLPSNAVISHAIEELIDDEGFEKVINEEISCENFTFIQYSNRNYTKSNQKKLEYSFQEIEKEVNPKYGYSQRLQLLEDNRDGKTETLKKEITKQRSRKTEIESWDLKQVFQEVDLDQYLSEFTNNDLLRNLILNGYINENYNDYISLFHEGSITKEDFAFERSVKAGYPPNFTYKLNKIEGILERIDLRYFGKECILNFDLLDYLGNNHQKYPNHYTAIILLLSSEKEKPIKFINEYLKNEERPIQHFIEKLTAQWKNFFHYIVEESVYDRGVINNYLRLILTYAKKDTILNNQAYRPLIEMISTNSEFLSLVKNKEGLDFFGKITSVIKGLAIKFESLANPYSETQKLFDYVYQNNYYTITKENVLQMLEVYTEGVDIDAFNTKNYSTIQKSGLTYLVQYIDQNINFYIENVYLKIDTNTQEDQDYLIELLNSNDISDSNKKAIIEKTETIVSDISRIIDDNELRVFIFMNNKVEATWENIYEVRQYYDEVSEDIIDFVNNCENAKRLSILPVSKEKDGNGKMPYIQMWKDILASPTLLIESFKLLLGSSNILIRFFDFENTAKDRLEIMIADKHFAFENQVFDKLEESHSLGSFYLENYKKEILALKKGFTFEEKHLTEIFSSKGYSVLEINTILHVHDIDNWQSESFLSSMQNRLAEEKGLTIDTSKIIEAASSHYLDVYNVKILNNYFDKFSRAEIRTMLESLKDSEYQKYLSTSIVESLKLEHKSYNDILFNLMKARGYIGNKSKQTKKGYQIFKNKHTVSL